MRNANETGNGNAGRILRNFDKVRAAALARCEAAFEAERAARRFESPRGFVAALDGTRTATNSASGTLTA